MALNLQQLQKQTQRLIMTPQMQQSIQLLQLNAIELEQLAEQELTENPFLTLEEDGPEPGDPDTAAGDMERERDRAEVMGEGDWEGNPRDDMGDIAGFEAERAVAGAEAPLLTEAPEGGSPADDGGEPGDGAEPSGEITEADLFGMGGGVPEDGEMPEAPSMETAPEQFDQVDLNWDDYYSDADNVYAGTHEDLEERDFSEYVAARTSLNDHLTWQLRCCTLEGLDKQIGEYIIGSLNDDGYLDPDIVTETATQFAVEPPVVERVLSILQEFDPPGIFARTLAESLLIQMKALGSYSELARVVLEEHLVEFQKKKFRELARKLGVEEAQLQDILKKISRLEPHPGRSLTAASVQYIQPDVHVKIIDGQLIIYLNEGPTSRLSLDRFYQRLMRQQAKAMNQQERDYALEKYRSAVTLIKNIEKRKSTILRVTEAIMEVQRTFLDQGVEALKPLTLREVAEMVGMHESTVARVTSRKYVETPQGTYPLKYFFSSSIETSTQGGEAVSSRAIKDKLQQIIGKEDPRKPLSDQRIAQMLFKDGFDIARRTVAKYREQLKILPAKYRRQT